MLDIRGFYLEGFPSQHSGERPGRAVLAHRRAPTTRFLRSVLRWPELRRDAARSWRPNSLDALSVD